MAVLAHGTEKLYVMFDLDYSYTTCTNYYVIKLITRSAFWVIPRRIDDIHSDRMH